MSRRKEAGSEAGNEDLDIGTVGAGGTGPAGTDDRDAIPIGAVTNLTGISGHTLRKWESRYQAIEPVRTPTGRRVYTQTHVRRLMLLKELIGQGHQISRLAPMEDEQLHAMAGEYTPAPAEVAFESVTVVGHVVSAVMSDSTAPSGVQIDTMAVPAVDWLREQASTLKSGTATEEPKAALIVELPTLAQRSVDALLELRRARFTRLIVVYGFAARPVLRQLQDGGCLCLKAPVSLAELNGYLASTDDVPSVVDFLRDASVPDRRFSDESIARLAAIAPKVECECPNHIALLLQSINAFEQYSTECEDTDPRERELHARLRLIAANARALFEEAMANVAAAEGLELDEA